VRGVEVKFTGVESCDFSFDNILGDKVTQNIIKTEITVKVTFSEVRLQRSL